MRSFIIAIICIVILDAVITCTKSGGSNPPPAPQCTSCSTDVVAHKKDSNGLYYFLPTAFTPNGDGINDVYRLVYDKLNPDSSSITIWDANYKGVYTGSINQSWDGTDLTGSKSPAGRYFVYMKLLTTAGAEITACTCVTILQYKGSCIYTGGNNYYLADELDVANGFVNPTTENLCP